jgi:hypothetical protein
MNRSDGYTPINARGSLSFFDVSMARNMDFANNMIQKTSRHAIRLAKRNGD